MHHTDEELLRRIQAKDSQAFEELHNRYVSALIRHARSIVHDEDSSADLIQEVFIRVWQKAEQWDGKGSVRSWLYKITTNLSLNHLRSQRRRPQQPLNPPAEYRTSDEYSDDWETRVPTRLIDAASLQPETVLEHSEEKRQLWTLVDELPGDKSQVFRLVYESEMDMRSVADVLDIPEGTVKSRIYHSKRLLAAMWEEYVEGM